MAAVELADDAPTTVAGDAFDTTFASGTLMIGFLEMVMCCCPSSVVDAVAAPAAVAYGTVMRACCGCVNVLLKMLIGCCVGVFRATDVAAEIGLAETDIDVFGPPAAFVVATFVRILFCVMITDEPGCAGCPENSTVDPPPICLTTENVWVLVDADEFSVTGDRLRLVIGDTLRRCLSTKMLPPPDVVAIEPMLFWLNACVEVRILPAATVVLDAEAVTVAGADDAVTATAVAVVTAVCIDSVTIFGPTTSILTFRSLLRLAASTFSKLVCNGAFSVLVVIDVPVMEEEAVTLTVVGTAKLFAID